jgi:tRNA modification GTPase
MIEISGYAAAILDYDKNDLPENIGEKLQNGAKKLHGEISNAISGYKATRAVRSGFNIVLTGNTNVGKSSLFNAIIGESRAIVSDIPGTTRDVVSADIDIDGYLVHLSDTAGLRESDDAIEKIGIEKTYQAAKNADLILRVYAQPNDAAPAENEIIVFNKHDVTGVGVSAATGHGIPELMESIKAKIHEMMDGAASDLSVNEHTRELLIDAANELNCAIDNDSDYDIFAEHVRRAGTSIGKILGAIDASEIMDATFNQLCLGK